MDSGPEDASRPSADTRLSAIDAQARLRLVAAVTTDTVRETCRRQSAQPSEALALARLITSAALMASIAKGDKERLRIHIRNRGASRSLIADAHGDGRTRACLERRLSEDAPKELRERSPGPSGRGSITRLLAGSGEINVVRDLGLSQPYQGSSAIQTGEIDEDLQNFLRESEQLPSVLACEALYDGDGLLICSVGVLAQTLPDADPKLLESVASRVSRGALYRWLETTQQPGAGQPNVDPEALLNWALGGQDHQTMGARPIRFHCPCGPARARSVLATLGAQDLDKLAKEQPETSIDCQFCGERVTLTADQVAEIANELRRGRN